MSGLIWAGLGKGISDAGASYGNMMFKAAESELADQRAMQRAEALERLREQMLEERAQKDAAKAVEIDQRATQIGEQRATKQLGADATSLANNAQKIAGDSPAMTQEEMQAHLESLSPSERKAIEGTGLVGRSLTRNQQRLQSADDSIQAARELGASSNLLKSYQDVKKTVLDEIREENRDRRAAEAEEGRDRRASAAEDRRSREFQSLLPIRQQTADAATTRANKPSSGGSDSGNKPITGVDLERSAKAAEKALALELGVPVKDLQSEVARLKKRNQLTPEAQTKLEDYNTSLSRWQNYKSDTKAPKSGDNTGTRPPLSSFMR